jgi:hypothetical protein
MQRDIQVKDSTLVHTALHPPSHSHDSSKKIKFQRTFAEEPGRDNGGNGGRPEAENESSRVKASKSAKMK